MLCIILRTATFPQISDSAALSPLFLSAQSAPYARKTHEKADENQLAIVADFYYENTP
jgi:hypothetical protein